MYTVGVTSAILLVVMYLLGRTFSVVWLLVILVFDVSALLITVQVYDTQEFSAMHPHTDFLYSGLCFVSVFCIPVDTNSWLCCKHILQGRYWGFVLSMNSTIVLLLYSTMSRDSVPGDCLSVDKVHNGDIMPVAIISLGTVCNVIYSHYNFIDNDSTSVQGVGWLQHWGHILAKVLLVATSLVLLAVTQYPQQGTWHAGCQQDLQRQIPMFCDFRGIRGMSQFGLVYNTDKWLNLLLAAHLFLVFFYHTAQFRVLIASYTRAHALHQLSVQIVCIMFVCAAGAFAASTSNSSSCHAYTIDPEQLYYTHRQSIGHSHNIMKSLCTTVLVGCTLILAQCMYGIQHKQQRLFMVAAFVFLVLLHCICFWMDLMFALIMLLITVSSLIYVVTLSYHLHNEG